MDKYIKKRKQHNKQTTNNIHKTEIQTLQTHIHNKTEKTPKYIKTESKTYNINQ